MYIFPTEDQPTCATINLSMWLQESLHRYVDVYIPRRRSIYGCGNATPKYVAPGIPESKCSCVHSLGNDQSNHMAPDIMWSR